MAITWMTSAHWFAPLLVSVFVLAGALWMGTLFSVSWLSGRARMMADGPEIGRLSLSLFHRWTMPSLVVSLVAGALWCAGIGVENQPPRWLCALLVAGLVPLGLSGAVGNAARRLVRGRLE